MLKAVKIDVSYIFMLRKYMLYATRSKHRSSLLIGLNLIMPFRHLFFTEKDESPLS